MKMSLDEAVAACRLPISASVSYCEPAPIFQAYNPHIDGWIITITGGDVTVRCNQPRNATAYYTWIRSRLLAEAEKEE